MFFYHRRGWRPPPPPVPHRHGCGCGCGPVLLIPLFLFFAALLRYAVWY